MIRAAQKRTPAGRMVVPSDIADRLTLDALGTAFGDDVVDHYTNMADVELAAFDAAVTDWELRRSFERM